MAIITALQIQKRNKERVNIYLDDQYAFSVNLIDAAKLRKGQTISESEIAALCAEDAVVKAAERAIRFLSYRPRSVLEVRRNLLQKAIDETVVDAAVARLQAMGYLDDDAFARFWVENRTMFKPLGPTALRYELRQKGITDTTINAVLGEIDAQETAYHAAQPQVRKLRGADRRTFRNKLGSFLQRRGFHFETINGVLERLMDDLDDDYFGTDDAEDE